MPFLVVLCGISLEPVSQLYCDIPLPAVAVKGAVLILWVMPALELNILCMSSFCWDYII